jgi:AcrR family transcriptional regulator
VTSGGIIPEYGYTVLDMPKVFLYSITDQSVGLQEKVINRAGFGASMSPRPDVSHKRKNQILDAATIVFADAGFNHARMDDIADQSGLSKGAIYWYFKSKDEIIIAILARMFEREFRDLESILDTTGSATERLEIIIDRTLDDIDHLLGLIPITFEFLALAFREKAVQDTFTKYFKGYLDILVPILESGIKSGEFRSINTIDTAIAMGAIFEGTILLWVYDRESIEISKHIRVGMDLLTEGLRL